MKKYIFPMLAGMFLVTSATISLTSSNTIGKGVSVKFESKDPTGTFDVMNGTISFDEDKLGEASFDYVIVPLLGFDKQGYRIGYGKGFYDRFLSKCSFKTQFIGISIYEPFEVISDVEPSDIKLHACITPDSIFRF